MNTVCSTALPPDKYSHGLQWILLILGKVTTVFALISAPPNGFFDYHYISAPPSCEQTRSAKRTHCASKVHEQEQAASKE